MAAAVEGLLDAFPPRNVDRAVDRAVESLEEPRVVLPPIFSLKS